MFVSFLLQLFKTVSLTCLCVKPMGLEQVLSDRDSEDEVDDDIADLEDRRVCLIVYILFSYLSKFESCYQLQSWTMFLPAYSSQALGHMYIL